MFPSRLLTILSIASVLACSDLPPLPIGLEFRGEIPGQCPSQDCADYGLDCGAVVSIRVFSADADPFSSEPPITESCIAINPEDDVCALAGAGLELGALPADRVRVEVAIWNPEDLDTICPEGPMFDLDGLPLTTFDPQPAFGGSTIINAGDENIDLASIELACFDDDPLGVCGTEETTVTARIDDLDTLLFAPALAAVNLRVSVGVPKSQPAKGGGTVFVIDAADDYEIDLARTVPVPGFESLVPATFSDVACLQVLDVAPQSTTAVTCSVFTEALDPLDMVGYLVAKQRVDEVLGVLGEPSFPTSGVVVGRVIDAVGQPSGDTTVTATVPGGGTAQVLYVDEGFTTASEIGPTASHGFFLSTTSPFGSSWTAEHSDGRIEQQASVTGLIEGKVTALVIPLTPGVPSSSSPRR